MPSITICTFLTLTNGFKLYDQNLALTGGQPFRQLADGNVIKTTEMLALNIVILQYPAIPRAPGQAKAVMFFILVGIIGIVQLVVHAERRRCSSNEEDLPRSTQKSARTTVLTVVLCSFGCCHTCYPILLVLINSFKTNASINTRHLRPAQQRDVHGIGRTISRA